MFPRLYRIFVDFRCRLVLGVLDKPGKNIKTDAKETGGGGKLAHAVAVLRSLSKTLIGHT